MPTLSVILPAGALALLVGLGGCTGMPTVAQPYQPVAVVAPGSTYIGTQCVAGAYQCVLPAAGPLGTPCSCPGLGAPSYGVIRY